MRLFNCHVREEAGTVILDVNGEIDLATAPLLDADLRRCLERSQPIIVDVSKVAYCDMSGVRALERFYQALGDRSHDLVVVSPPGIIRRLFALVELDTRITIADTLDGARALLPHAGTRLMGLGEG